MIESDIEQMVIKQLESQGYTYVYGPDIESKSLEPLRNYKQVILHDERSGRVFSEGVGTGIAKN